MKILVTGAAGFIGYHVSKKLVESGNEVIGIDNINNYYDVDLKYARLKDLGISRAPVEIYNNPVLSEKSHYSFKFIRINLEDQIELPKIFESEKFDIVCNLAAQAGVRYSLENPMLYVNSNIVGFANLLECCRNINIKHLVYASSSSVYGLNKKIPFATQDNVDSPISLYAASKKSNELMAHTYSHLFNFPTTGLRFFTVYGPWGRPDMAISVFTNAIIKNQPIDVVNNGNMERDFTYIDDVVSSVVKIIEKPVKNRLYKIYNIGNNISVKLLDFIKEIENNLDTVAQKNMLPMQPGDVEKTWADVNELIKDYNYKPDTSIKKGIKAFISWYKLYYK